MAERFLFDLSFDGPGEPRASRGPVTPAEPTFGRAELAAAEAAARTEGYAAGSAEALSDHEHRLAASMADLSLRIGMLIQSSETARHDAERGAIQLARAAMARLFPALARKSGLAEITALVTQCLREAADEPRLVLRVPDDLFDAAQEQIKPLASTAGFAGKVIILADDTLGSGDCRVEWADGGAERDTARGWQEIDSAIAKACARMTEHDERPADPATTP